MRREGREIQIERLKGLKSVAGREVREKSRLERKKERKQERKKGREKRERRTRQLDSTLLFLLLLVRAASRTHS